MNPATPILQTSIDSYKLYDGATVQESGVIMSALQSIRQQPTVVNTRFFCRANLDLLQRTIATIVKQRTGMQIDRQSDDQLLIVMRAVYLEGNAVNDPADPTGAVQKLNAATVDQVVPIVASNVLQYVAYLRDASTVPYMQAGPVSTSIKGTKTLVLANQMM